MWKNDHLLGIHRLYLRYLVNWCWFFVLDHHSHTILGIINRLRSLREFPPWTFLTFLNVSSIENKYIKTRNRKMFFLSFWIDICDSVSHFYLFVFKISKKSFLDSLLLHFCGYFCLFLNTFCILIVFRFFISPKCLMLFLSQFDLWQSGIFDKNFDSFLSHFWNVGTYSEPEYPNL